jgi:signal transduction histidine kinase
MTSDNLRNLKHELRTPLNHILGYSSLVREAADDAGDNAVARLVNGICANAQIVLSVLEKNLRSPNGDMDETQMVTLCTSVRPVVGQILNALPSAPELPASSTYAADFERIRCAANGLLLLLKVNAGEHSLD